MKQTLIILLMLLLVTACDDVNDPEFNNKTITATFEKLNSDGQWKTGFSDCPSDTAGYKINFDITELPAATNKNSKSLKISSENLSSDLFLYSYRKITGFKKGGEYTVDFKLSLASKYIKESVGAGGSPADDVTLKAGIVAKEPSSSVKDGNYVFNLEKGNQAQEGNEMKILGDIAIPGTKNEYTLIERTFEGFTFTADSNGEAWIVVGTESGYMGNTTIYYEKLEMKFKLKD